MRKFIIAVVVVLGIYQFGIPYYQVSNLKDSGFQEYSETNISGFWDNLFLGLENKIGKAFDQDFRPVGEFNLSTFHEGDKVDVITSGDESHKNLSYKGYIPYNDVHFFMKSISGRERIFYISGDKLKSIARK